MLELSLWLHFKDILKVPLPTSSTSSIIGITSTSLISQDSQNSLLIFKDPYNSAPSQISFSFVIHEIACNSHMSLFLTLSGTVWALGEDQNKSGLFAQEDLFISEVPIQIPVPSDSKIISISLGAFHCGLANEEGFLFTWGSGDNGELGSPLTRINKATKVENGNIYKAKQVICGNSFTAVVTLGGFLYIYGPRTQCECGGISGFPYTVPALEEYYVSKAYSSDFGVVVLTDAFKCYVVPGCLCLTNLRASKKIREIAACSSGICGISKDKSNIFMWNKVNNKEWRGRCFRVNETGVKRIVGSCGSAVAVCGSRLKSFPGQECTWNNSPDMSPVQDRENYRKSFEQLIGNYDFSAQVNQASMQKVEAAKQLMHILGKPLAEALRKIKEYSYVQFVYKKAYSSTFLVNVLRKVTERMGRVDKRLAVFALFQHSRAQRRFGRCVFFRSHLGLLCRIAQERALGVFLAVLKSSESSIYYKVCGNRLKSIVRQRCLEFFKSVSASRGLSSAGFRLELAIRMLQKHIMVTEKSYIDKWLLSTSAAATRQLIFNQKLNAVLWLNKSLSKHIKSKLSLFFHSIKSNPNVYQVKYGVYFLYSCLSKLQNKHKSYSFNCILRQKTKSIPIETLIDCLKLILRSKTLTAFRSIKSFATTQKNRNLIKFILMFQSIQEKIKYRKVIKGFNAFKVNSFNKSITIDFASEKSFNSKSIKPIATPHSESPSFEINILATERSTMETCNTNNERRSSLHNFQKILVKKFSEMITNESKSGVVKKSGAETERGKVKNTGLEKRMAYCEALKERQKKGLVKKSSRKPSLNIANAVKAAVSAKSSSGYVFNAADWKKTKYQQSFVSLAKALSTTINNRVRLPFNKLKFSLNTPSTPRSIKGNKPTYTRSQCKLLSNRQSHRKLSIETGANCIKKSNYESPMESPIPMANESLPATPFIFLNSPKSLVIPAVSWKVKLYALGLTKFSRSFKLILMRISLASLKLNAN